MLTQAEAKPIIIGKFRDYLAENGVIRATVMDARMFWDEFRARDPSFLFTGGGEPWSAVRTWLTQAGLIKDL